MARVAPGRRAAQAALRSLITKPRDREVVCHASAWDLDDRDDVRICSFYGSKAAGRKLQAMLEAGQSRPWPDVLYAMTGERRMDAGALLEYFAPLQAWLDRQNQGRTLGWKGAYASAGTR